jgi:hypothetical protein
VHCTTVHFGSKQLTRKTTTMTGDEPQAFAASASQAYDTARRAMFAAASRVLSYHAAALDAKVAGMNPPLGQAQGMPRLLSQAHPG